MATLEDNSGAVELYCAVAGFNGKLWASHVYAWMLKRGGEVICSNRQSPARLVEGSIDKGFYHAILEAIPHSPEGGPVQLIAPRGSELYWVFRETPAERRKAGYRKKSKKGKVLRPNHLAQRQVDALCADRGILLLVDEPRSNEEIEARYSIEDDAKQRLRDALEAETLGT